MLLAFRRQETGCKALAMQENYPVPKANGVLVEKNIPHSTLILSPTLSCTLVVNITSHGMTCSLEKSLAHMGELCASWCEELCDYSGQ
jgi:hypothetical protein